MRTDRYALTMDEPQPLSLSTIEVEPGWIDYNGHMNVGYYSVAFDRAGDVLIDRLGMDAQYRAQSACSVYVLETRVAFLRELKLGEKVAVDVQLLDFDNKRLHYFMRMMHADGTTVCACTEILLMHIDMQSVRGAPMPESVLRKVRALAESQRGLPRPENFDARIGIRR